MIIPAFHKSISPPSQHGFRLFGIPIWLVNDPRKCDLLDHIGNQEVFVL